MELRPILPEHDPLFRAFRCARFRQPWTQDIEDMIRDRLTESLRTGEAEGLGVWNDGTLCGLIAFARGAEEWHVAVLAVNEGWGRKGIATRLMTTVVELARQADADVVTSFIHRDNEPMFKLNRRLGANLHPDDVSRVTFVCTVPLH